MVVGLMHARESSKASKLFNTENLYHYFFLSETRVLFSLLNNTETRVLFSFLKLM